MKHMRLRKPAVLTESVHPDTGQPVGLSKKTAALFRTAALDLARLTPPTAAEVLAAIQAEAMDGDCAPWTRNEFKTYLNRYRAADPDNREPADALLTALDDLTERELSVPAQYQPMYAPLLLLAYRFSLNPRLASIS